MVLSRGYVAAFLPASQWTKEPISDILSFTVPLFVGPTRPRSWHSSLDKILGFPERRQVLPSFSRQNLLKGVPRARAPFACLLKSPRSPSCASAAPFSPHSFLPEFSDSVQFDFELESPRKHKLQSLPPYQQLLLLKQQGLSIKQYIRKFCTLVSEIPISERPADHILLSQFIDGLAFPVQLWEYLNKPQSTVTAILIAISYESSLFDFLASHNNRKSCQHQS